MLYRFCTLGNFSSLISTVLFVELFRFMLFIYRFMRLDLSMATSDFFLSREIMLMLCFSLSITLSEFYAGRTFFSFSSMGRLSTSVMPVRSSMV